MKAIISGDRYKFLVILENYNGKYAFEILSIYKNTNQKSTITNLNFIISDIISSILEIPDIDTTIILSKTKGIRLFQKAISAFGDKFWIQYLEKELDIDRDIGGWNSDFQI